MEFDNTPKHFASATALFSVTFDGTENDQVSIDALEQSDESSAPTI